MFVSLNRTYRIVALAAVFCVASQATWPFKKKKYEDPITKKTDQPDKVLFDKAIDDIEHGRYEVARITLNTLINTYDTSEFLAKAKLAIADSWYREGGSHAWAQAEAEYKDFKLFYPTMEEAAESQEKVCTIHYRQMEKADRDSNQAHRAEDECRQLLLDYPNSKFAPHAQQLLRNIQEVLAQGEYATGKFYFSKGSYPAAANRLQYIADQYPLFSQGDENLWMLADAYHRMGDRFEDRAAAAYTRIVKDYPLSAHAEEAADQLKAMNRPVPEADATRYAWQKYEEENRKKIGLRREVMDAFGHSPETRMAARSGTPMMTSLRPSVPLSVPVAAATATTPTTGGTSDVTIGTVSDPTALDTKPDARANPGAAATAPAGPQSAAGTGDGSAARSATTPATEPAGTAGAQPLPMNHQNLIKKSKKQRKAEEEARKKQAQNLAQPAAAQTPAQGQPVAQPQGTQPNQ